MKMYAPEGVTSASVGNLQLTVDADGAVEVEATEDAQALKSHGFVEDKPVVKTSKKEK